MIGEIFRLASVPLHYIAASPICRASQTATLAFGRIDSLVPSTIHTPVVNSENAGQFAQKLKETLQTIPLVEGKNTVIMAHGSTLENQADLFESGQNHFGGTPIQETGFYAIERQADGSLRILHKFLNLGEFAASALTLSP